MYYFLKNRKGQVFAVSTYPGLASFRKPGDTFGKAEEWPLQGMKKEEELPSPPPKAEPTVRPKFRSSTCAYLMYV